LKGVPHVGGERCRLPRRDRIVLELLDAREPIEAIIPAPLQQAEAPLAVGEDVGPPVGELVRRADHRHAPDVARARDGFHIASCRDRDVRDPEPAVSREAIGEHLAVARLEDV
jgi:hypothetical protein